VALIAIKPADKRLQTNRWELVQADQNSPVTRLHPGTPIPTCVQEISIMPNNCVTRAPLVLGFEEILLRPAVPLETGLIFTAV
jgi:hypothetical protein